MADEPRSAPLVIPTPEELGIVVPKPVARDRAQPEVADWTATRAALDRLGAMAFTLEQAGMGYRFSCRLSAGRLVEGRGATEAEAIRLALEQAERR
jgi:hypothetical protein